MPIPREFRTAFGGFHSYRWPNSFFFPRFETSSARSIYWILINDALFAKTNCQTAQKVRFHNLNIRNLGIQLFHNFAVVSRQGRNGYLGILRITQHSEGKSHAIQSASRPTNLGYERAPLNSLLLFSQSGQCTFTLIEL